MIKWIGGFIMILFCYGCDQRDDMLLSEKKVADIFFDIALSDQIINQYRPDERDSIRQMLKESLLTIHGVTQSQIDTNINLYMSDFEKFDRVSNLLLSKIDSLEEEAK